MEEDTMTWAGAAEEAERLSGAADSAQGAQLHQPAPLPAALRLSGRMIRVRDLLALLCEQDPDALVFGDVGGEYIVQSFTVHPVFVDGVSGLPRGWVASRFEDRGPLVPGVKIRCD